MRTTISCAASRNNFLQILLNLFRVVITLLRTFDRRVVLAITLSVLLHAAILWLLQIRLPRNEVQLPPLTARLEVMPEPVVQSAKPEPAKPVTTSGVAASAQPTAEAADKVEEPVAQHLFPHHVYLTFAVYKGVDGFKIGDVHHRLEINRDRYILRAVKRITGLAGPLNNEQTTQTSRGRIVKQGLQPESFTEEKTANGSRQNLKVTFDWVARKMRFGRDRDTSLPDDAQDVLSFTYQLSQLSMHREIIPFAISDGRQFENYELEIGGKEEISTPIGKVRALHLRKMHARGEAYFEIWLGLEYRLLPVKFRQVDSSNAVTEEVVISDIRVADE